MGSSFKEVQRKLELSLEDLLDEEKSKHRVRHLRRQGAVCAGHDPRRVDRSYGGIQKSSRHQHDSRLHVAAHPEKKDTQGQPAHCPLDGATRDTPYCSSNQTSITDATPRIDPFQWSGQPSGQSDRAAGKQKEQSATAAEDKDEQLLSAAQAGNASGEPSGPVAGAPTSLAGGGSLPSAPSGSTRSGQLDSQTGPAPSGTPSGCPSGAPGKPAANSPVQPGPPPEGPPPHSHSSHLRPGSFYPRGLPPHWGYPCCFPPPSYRGPYFPHDAHGRPFYDHGHTVYPPVHGPDPRVHYGPPSYAVAPRLAPHSAYGGQDLPRQPHQSAHVPNPAFPAASSSSSAVLHGYQVRLSNIPPELTARDLAEAFVEVSQTRVESVDILRDHVGRNTGVALVVFNSISDAQNAVRRYHGGDLNGHRLDVAFEGEVNAVAQR